MDRCRVATRRLFPLLIGAAVVSVSSGARAGTGYEFPDSGTEQLGRAGAWLARASNPLATYFNPAGLAGQRTALTLSTNLIWQKNCFRRTDKTGNPLPLGNAYTYPAEVCNTDSGKPFPNPQAAFVWRVSPTLGIGFAALGPSARGNFDYPRLSPGSWHGTTRDVPGPQRYMLMSDSLVFAWPQIGVGWEVTDGFRVGASLIWGFAVFDYETVSSGFSTADHYTASGDPIDSFDKDFDANLHASDPFVPGFTLGLLWSASQRVDVAGWYQWMDDIRATGATTIKGPIYGAQPASSPSDSYSSTTPDGSVKVVAPWPMQARVGVRYHHPRGGKPAVLDHVRDPMSQDLFDVELDVTWANNSHFDNLEVTLPPNLSFSVAGIDMKIPENASIRHKWKDSFGVRMGGDFVVLADTLSLRAGGFFQTSSQDPAYLNLDFIASQRAGFDLGATVRLSGLDLMVGYGHVFFSGLDNGGEGAVHGLSGNAPYRTEQAINGGSISSSVNVASLGATYTF